MDNFVAVDFLPPPRTPPKTTKTYSPHT
ncbi:hypothetical protein BN2475_70106 [Paraburkholderia ribeironis]|uniref:Uncharacterized protein n=1 Tax=Paraburkholderia ribeironis TaxID=1247936 RepID=A0A1N7RM08_9BURK|nr:hypothetical protein BN2475_70106 [Paraburkholderia ribeironis]